MSSIQRLDQLLSLWGDVAHHADPFSALAARGASVEFPLRERLGRRRAVPGLSVAQRERLGAVLKTSRRSPIGTVRYGIGRTAREVTRGLPPGEYDVVLGVRLEVLVDVLAGLYETREWPHELGPELIGNYVDVEDLRLLSDDLPSIEGLTTGTLHLTAPATVAITGADRLLLNQPFRLDIDAVTDDSPRRRAVSAPEADLHVAVPLDVNVTGNTLQVILGTTEGTGAASGLDVRPGSPLQPHDASALEAFAEPLISGLLLEMLRHPVQICPTLRLPVGESLPISAHHVDVLSVDTVEGEGALMIGVVVAVDGEDLSQVEASTNTLLIDPFKRSTGSIYVRLHEALLNRIAATEATQTAVEESMPSKAGFHPRVKDVRVELRAPDTVRLVIHAVLRNVCGPGPFTFIDLDFDVTTDLRTTPFGGELVLSGEPKIDFDNSDLAVCALSGGWDLATAVFGVKGVATLIGLMFALLYRADSLGKDVPVVVDTHAVVPGTELAPRVEVTQMRAGSQVLELMGELSLRPDDEHLFAYLRVVQRPRVALPTSREDPVRDATVLVFDQDSPRPPGDDARVPEEGTEVTFAGPKRLVTVDVSYDPPISDDLLGEGRTDDDGYVRLVLERRTTSGTVVTTTTHSLLDQPSSDPQVQVSRRTLAEPLPDVYLKVTLPDGRRIDLRHAEGGTSLITNADGRRIGEPDAPLVVSVPPPPQVVY